MAVRTDTVQLNIEFITDESRALAKANVDTKALTTELRKTVRAGGDVADVMQRIEKAGGKVADIDLSKVAPKQLITRARQLKQVLDQLPASSPRVAKLSAEYKRINDRLATVRQQTRGVAASMQGKGGILQSLRGGALAALAFAAGLVQTFRALIQATSLTQRYGKVLERELGSKSAAQKAIKDITKLADGLGKPADQLLGSYTKLVSRGIKPTTDELTKLVDLAASQGKEVDQLTEALLDAGTLEFERLKEFGIKAKQSGDQVALSFKGQTIEVEKNQDAILNAILGFGDLQSIQGAAADGADNLGGKVDRLTGFFDRLLSNLGEGGLGDAIGDLIDNAASLLKIFVDLTDVQDGLTTEVRGTQAAFNLEIETLKRGNISSETRAKLIDSINTKYADYLPNLLSEESTLGDIARAQEMANRQFEQRIILLAAEEQLTEVAQRRLEAKSKELELELELTEARERTLDAEKRAAGNTAGSQSFAGTGAARGVSGQAGADSLAAQALDRLNENKEEQIKLEEEFQRTLQAGKDLGLDIDSILNPPSTTRGGGGDKKKKTLEDALKLVREKFAIVEEISEQAFIRGETTESDYQKNLLELQAAEYEAQLLLFGRFNKDKTSQAEKARTELLRVQKKLNPQTRGATKSISFDTEVGVERGGVAAGVDAVIAQAAKEADALQRARNADLINQEQFELARLELKRNLLAQEAEILRTGTDEEVKIAFEKGEQIKAIEQGIFEKKKSLAEREQELKREVGQTAIDSAQEGLGALVDVLGKDEAARKKNFGAIKSFQKGQAIVSGLNELQQIRLATAAQAASVAAIPGAAIPVYIAGAIRAAAAIAQTAVSVGKINATKFARGGKIGQFGGRSHAQGGTRGYFDDGTQIEVEKGETFAIVNKNARGLLSHLSDVNQATGGVAFARGGIALGSAPNTTPIVSSATLAASAAPAADQTALLARIDTLTEVTANMQTRLRADVVYTDIEAAAAEVSTVRTAAEI